MVDDVPVAPNIWTDGSREPIITLMMRLLGLVLLFILRLSSLIVIIGVMLKTLMILMRAALTFFGCFRPNSVGPKG